MPSIDHGSPCNKLEDTFSGVGLYSFKNCKKNAVGRTSIQTSAWQHVSAFPNEQKDHTLREAELYQMPFGNPETQSTSDWHQPSKVELLHRHILFQARPHRHIQACYCGSKVERMIV
jgi:hypothetical protein